MAFNERLEKIGVMIQKVKRVSVNDLSNRFKVSYVTIRKDLDELQARGLLVRTHGGAILAEDFDRTHAIDQQRALGKNENAKLAIARKAVELLDHADTVILDSGSTAWAMAKLLKESDVRIVTNSMTIIQELSSRSSGSLVCIGGNWRYEIASFVGPLAIKYLENINVDIAIIGTNGFSLQSGFTSLNTQVGQLKATMLKRAQRRYIIGDSTKWDVSAFYTFAGLHEVDALITDSDLTAETRQSLENAGLHVIIAPMTKTSLV